MTQDQKDRFVFAYSARAGGMKWKELAERLGVSLNRARELSNRGERIKNFEVQGIDCSVKEDRLLPQCQFKEYR